MVNATDLVTLLTDYTVAQNTVDHLMMRMTVGFFFMLLLFCFHLFVD